MKNNNNNIANTPITTTVIKTITFKGWEIILTEIEISITPGIPIMSIVGLPNKTVNEAKERIRCALSHMGIGLPVGRIIINLSPGDLIKEGTHYDLGILCGLLVHMKLLDMEHSHEYIFFGEIQLNGDILSTYGGLPVGIFAYKNNYKLISSSGSSHELSGLYEHKANILLFTNILNLVLYFTKGDYGRLVSIQETPIIKETPSEDGHFLLSPLTKRLIEIAIVGYHNVLLLGPPGGGKTTLAKVMPSLLPTLNRHESLEVSSIYSMCGLLNQQLITNPPFRCPHSSTSMYGLLGGGSKPKPGEVSLSHKGLLFLDEINQFHPHILDSLRECLTEDMVRVSRVNYQISYPAEIQLIAAMNPCKCGFFGSKNKICTCSNKVLENYRQKISGPFLDRIAIKFFLEEPSYDKVTNQKEWMENTKKKIVNNRNTINDIYKTITTTKKISRIPFYILEEHTQITHRASLLLKKYCEDKKLSLRNYHNIFRLSTTISLINNRNIIQEEDVSEGIFFSNNTHC